MSSVPATLSALLKASGGISLPDTSHVSLYAESSTKLFRTLWSDGTEFLTLNYSGAWPSTGHCLVAGTAGVVTDGGVPIVSGTAAGGVLSGTYPNPGFAAIAANSVLANNSGSSAAPAATAFNTISLSKFAAPTADVSLGGFKLTNIAAGALTTDGVNLGQVTQLIATGVHAYLDVQTIATTNVNIASPGAIFSGYSPNNGDVLVLTGQTTGSENGPWTFNGASSPLTRPTEYASGSTVRAGYMVIVGDGTYAGYLGYLQTDDVVVDTDPSTWAVAPGPLGYTNAAPVTLVGNQIGLSYDSTLTLSGSSLSVVYGTASNTAAQGNDSRITGALQSAGATNHAVLLGTGSTAVGALTVGTAGRLLLDQGAAADPAFQAMSGDATLAASGALTLATVTIGKGGTGQTSAAAAFNALSPVTTLGDLIYGSGTNANTRLAGNTAATKMFLSQTGTGSVSAAPAWATIANTDVSGLGTFATQNYATPPVIGGTTPNTAYFSKVRIGDITSPSALLSLKAGTATAGTAPIQFTLSGAALLTAPVAGTLEPDSSGNLYFTNSTPTRNQIAVLGAAQTWSATQTLNFNDAGTSGVGIGLASIINATPASASTRGLYAGEFIAKAVSSSAITATIVGTYNSAQQYGAGTVSGFAASYNQLLINNASAGVIANGYGLFVAPPSYAAAPASQVFTNLYGLYVAAQYDATHAPSAYGIYQAGTSDKNYFAGVSTFNAGVSAVGVDASGGAPVSGVVNAVIYRIIGSTALTYSSSGPTLILGGSATWTATQLRANNVAFLTLTSGTPNTITIADGTNVIAGTVTGSTFATAANQKQAWWGATPVVQPTRVGPVVNNSTGSSTAPTIPDAIAATVDTTAASLTSVRNALASIGAILISIETRLSGAAGGIGLTA